MTLTPAARRALEFGASEALFDVHCMLMQTEPTADEPRHVCVMTQVGSLLLYYAWKDILAQARIQLRVTGVFCHQTPKAHFHTPSDYHWSATVQELLNVTAAKALPQKMPGPLIPDRGIAFGFVQFGTPYSSVAAVSFSQVEFIVSRPMAQKKCPKKEFRSF